MDRLKGKVAVVTGGLGGIGKATSLRFMREGASVAVWDIDLAKGTAFEAECQKKGYSMKFYQVNITDVAAAQAAAMAVVEDFGQIDILINNAGITRDATIVKMTEDQWSSVINVNLSGVFNCTKVVAPFMMERRYGRIVNAASIVAEYGNFGQTNYVASKAGVVGMTKVWARELGKKGITVNAIAPGFINTDMMRTIPDKVLDSFQEKTPLGRLGDPDEVAGAYLFLASDDSSFVNGTVLKVDGGLVF